MRLLTWSSIPHVKRGAFFFFFGGRIGRCGAPHRREKKITIKRGMQRKILQNSASGTRFQRYWPPGIVYRYCIVYQVYHRFSVEDAISQKYLNPILLIVLDIISIFRCIEISICYRYIDISKFRYVEISSFRSIKISNTFCLPSPGIDVLYMQILNESFDVYIISKSYISTIST